MPSADFRKIFHADGAAPPDSHILQINFIDITLNQDYFCSKMHHYDADCIDDRRL